MIEAPAAYRTDRNALFFTPCVTQGPERDLYEAIGRCAVLF